MTLLVVRELVKSMMTPMAITWILLLAILVLYLIGQKRLSKWMAFVAFGWFMVIQAISEPWNTKAEAAEYLKLFGTTGKLYLVTDATHMPRAMMHFRNTGLHPIAAPTNFYIKRNNIPKRFTNYFPSSGSIRNMEIVLNEYLGVLWAKMGGN